MNQDFFSEESEGSGNGTTPTLLQIYTPVFALMVAMEGTDRYGEPEEFASRVLQLLDSRRDLARRHNLDLDWVTDAQYAVVAFIDESISRSTWENRGAWIAAPLSVRIGMEANTGEGFFNKLEDWLRSPNPPLEVLGLFYTCLGLGFQGRYFDRPDELRKIREDLRRQLMAGREMRDVLAPHGQRPSGEIINPVEEFPWSWLLSISLGILALLFIVFKGCSDSHVQGLLRDLTAG